MIVFDLDGTLADCEHRRHYVQEPDKDGDENYYRYVSPDIELNQRSKKMIFIHRETGKRWHPNWDKFYEECDKDALIIPCAIFLRSVWAYTPYCPTIEIWSGRSESVREKTEKWLMDKGLLKCIVKMRPIGDYTPDNELKQKWLDEAIAEGKTIDFVVDDRKKVVDMWRRRGIFVFDVNQTGKEF